MKGKNAGSGADAAIGLERIVWVRLLYHLLAYWSEIGRIHDPVTRRARIPAAVSMPPCYKYVVKSVCDTIDCVEGGYCTCMFIYALV